MSHGLLPIPAKMSTMPLSMSSSLSTIFLEKLQCPFLSLLQLERISSLTSFLCPLPVPNKGPSKHFLKLQLHYQIIDGFEGIMNSEKARESYCQRSLAVNTRTTVGYNVVCRGEFSPTFLSTLVAKGADSLALLEVSIFSNVFSHSEVANALTALLRQSPNLSCLSSYDEKAGGRFRANE